MFDRKETRKHPPQFLRAEAGFTLLEIMVAAAAAAIIMLAVATMMTNHAKEAKNIGLRGDFDSVVNNLKAYLLANNNCMNVLQGPLKTAINNNLQINTGVDGGGTSTSISNPTGTVYLGGLSYTPPAGGAAIPLVTTSTTALSTGLTFYDPARNPATERGISFGPLILPSGGIPASANVAILTADLVLRAYKNAAVSVGTQVLTSPKLTISLNVSRNGASNNFKIDGCYYIGNTGMDLAAVCAALGRVKIDDTHCSDAPAPMVIIRSWQ